MINVNGLKRNAKNIVKKYSDAQVKVREATSNDPWGPSSTIMSEIADLTYNVVAFSEIMQMIWKRLNDHGKNWRHVYKALVLLEYLIKTGTEKVAQQCIENIFAIQTLKDFQYMEDNKDYGMNIREKSKKMVALLKDTEKLKSERARALKAKSRLAESMSSVGKSGLQGSMMSGSMGDTNNGTSSNGNSYLNYHNESGGSSTSAQHLQDGLGALTNSDLDSARPQSLTEEEQQLKLALALSKEEADQQEKTRKNDELRLKLALDVSKKTASSNLLDDFGEPSTSGMSGADSPAQTLSNTSQSQSGLMSDLPTVGSSKSTIDDLLGLTIPPSTNNSIVSNTNAAKSPFSTITQNNQQFSSVPVNNPFPEPQNDPWSVDPWSSTKSSTIAPTSSTTFNILPSTIPAPTSTATASQLQAVTAFNDLINSAMQSMHPGGVPGQAATALGNNRQANVPLSSTRPGAIADLTQVGSNNNNIFNDLTITNNSAAPISRKPVSSKNPFQD